jgi:hypothetical protein
MMNLDRMPDGHPSGLWITTIPDHRSIDFSSIQMCDFRSIFSQKASTANLQSREILIHLRVMQKFRYSNILFGSFKIIFVISSRDLIMSLPTDLTLWCHDLTIFEAIMKHYIDYLESMLLKLFKFYSHPQNWYLSMTNFLIRSLIFRNGNIDDWYFCQNHLNSVDFSDHLTEMMVLNLISKSFLLSCDLWWQTFWLSLLFWHFEIDEMISQYHDLPISWSDTETWKWPTITKWS